MLSALSFLVLTQAVVVPGSVTHGQGECPVVYFDGSHPVMLNCSNPSYARAPLVQWRWTDLFGKRKERLLLQVLNGNVSGHADRADMGISFQACAGNGNCSLTVNPAQDYAGLYHCVVWTSKRITEEKMWLIYGGEDRTHGAIYVAVGVGVGTLVLVLTGLVWFCKRKARDQGTQSAVSRVGPTSNQALYKNVDNGANRQGDRQTVNSTYMDLNLNEQEVYSNLIQ
ncbi:uncharacterized protein LOC132833935 [Hemiscyllium ocellatum]|uniref:uncharacterized protein LOC132833935 n=1 Tax=Hemiscyllium ocellatum TaxID=170820 RepID=UPI0029674F4D|nr:uncharacterized protein LOC132833935 [Hemiscyllium ocellatum]